jgi:3-oxoadipate enol-lactonase
MKVIANGIGQYYQRYGAGPPIVLIHALGLDHRLWEPQLSALAIGHTVYVYDVRGHGASDVPFMPYTLTDFADDLAGLLDALGIADAHLVGLSMGGMIAQEFALSWPDRVRSLVLADTTSEYPQEARRAFAERARIAEERGLGPLLEPTMDRWFTPEFRRDHPAEVERIRDILAVTDPRGYAASCRAIASIDVTERLVNIQAPSLVLVGAADTSTPPDMALKIHEYIPGSGYEVIPDAAHLINLARPDLFNRAVIATVQKGEAARGI